MDHPVVSLHKLLVDTVAATEAHEQRPRQQAELPLLEIQDLQGPTDLQSYSLPWRPIPPRPESFMP